MVETTKFYQHGTLALLVPGLFSGTIQISELLKKGDTGIGTVDGLDGEMIILEGEAFQITSEAQVNHLLKEQTTPFATVHFHDEKTAENMGKLKNLTSSDFTDGLIEKHQLKNVFAGIKVHGMFKQMHTRAVAKQNQPFAPLVEATRVQPEFKADNIEGTLVGYFAPTVFQGAAVAGFHLHFLSDDHSFGGHVLDFSIADAQGSIQIFETYEQHFPIQNKDYLTTDFDLAQIHRDIEEAEH